jgi:hypothetical protein
LSTLNLLKSDQSLLSKDEWSLLSNIIHCYDERSTISAGERFIRKQNSLPIKLRFRSESVTELLISSMTVARTCLLYNNHFTSLTSHNQFVLINTSMRHVATISTAFALSRSRLLDDPAFLKPLEIVFPPNVLTLIKRLTNQLDRDDTFIKLILGVIVFSTTNYVLQRDTIPMNLTDIKQFLHIQDIYIELAWKYLIYRYDYHQAIQCFLNVIRSIFISTESIKEASELAVYTDAIDSVVKQTEETLNLIN